MSALALAAVRVTLEVAIVGGDVPAARGRAIDEALVQSVVLAAAEANGDPSIPIPAQVLASARSYVDRYRVLEEAASGDTYRIVVEAEVAVGRLARALGPPGPRGPDEPAAPLEVEDRGPVRGAGLHAARARPRGQDGAAWAYGFGADASTARAAARAAAARRATRGRPDAGFDLTLTGVDSPSTLARIQDALGDRVPGVSAATPRRAGRARVALHVRATRPPAEIAAALAALPFDGFHLEMRSAEPAPLLAVVSP